MATRHRHTADRVADRTATGRPSAGSGDALTASDKAFARLFRDGYEFDFFQAVRLLERRFPDAPAPGTTSDYRTERIRFRPDVTPVFPATDVKRIEQVEEDGRPPRAHLTATFMGLYGVDSPLPYYFYDELATEKEDTFALRDFLDLFNHRLYSFFYRAWKKYRPALHYRSGGRDAHTNRFLEIAGLGTPGALVSPGRAAGRSGRKAHRNGSGRRESSEDAGPPVSRTRLAAFAGRLVGRQRNAEGLRALIAGFFEDLRVRIVENVPRWVPIREKPTMGSSDGSGGMALGRNSTVGEYVYDLTSRFRISLGPMGLDAYRALLPGAEDARRLHWLVRSYAPDHLDYEVELRLSADEVPAATLGGEAAQLGLTSFLGSPAHAEIARTVEY